MVIGGADIKPAAIKYMHANASQTATEHKTTRGPGGEGENPVPRGGAGRKTAIP